MGKLGVTNSLQVSIYICLWIKERRKTLTYNYHWNCFKSNWIPLFKKFTTFKYHIPPLHIQVYPVSILSFAILIIYMRYPTLASQKMTKKHLFINTRIKLCNLGQFTSFANFTYVRVHLSCSSTLSCLICSIPANVDINKTLCVDNNNNPRTKNQWGVTEPFWVVLTRARPVYFAASTTAGKTDSVTERWKLSAEIWWSRNLTSGPGRSWRISPPLIAPSSGTSESSRRVRWRRQASQR